MPQPTRILLLDDGELSNVARILQALGLEHTRIRGQQVIEQLTPPSELLITTPRCARLVRRGAPPEAPSGRPVRIIGVEENSSSMRRMLKRMGYHLLVGLPGSDEVWRPLIHRATYRGQERREGKRVVVGCAARVSRPGDRGNSIPATLMDISARTCQLLVPTKMDTQARLELTLPETATRGKTLTLEARVQRVCADLGGGFRTLVLDFDHAMGPDTRAELNGVIQLWSAGPACSPDGGLEARSGFAHETAGPGFSSGAVSIDSDTDSSSTPVPVRLGERSSGS
ncbi:MAG: hypothetical protein NZ990_18445 [Myxococcota bacterium]|nr:hypothetical protein [Myxococcota bacterium]